MLECLNITKNYGPKMVLQNIDLKVNKGEFIAIMGPSGSGKTTLLNMIATIDKPTAGAITINGKNPHTLTKEELAKFRRRSLGIVFQDFNLMHTLTVEENIVLPLTLDNIPVKKMQKLVQNIANELNITDILSKRIDEISGGQAQRTAVARAMIHKPQLLLADEPTGNLDTKSSKDVMKLLQTLNQNYDETILMVTHDSKDASYCQKVIFIQDGHLERILIKQGTQKKFYQEIMDVLTGMEGDDNEF